MRYCVIFELKLSEIRNIFQAKNDNDFNMYM